jgi:hypothetical protein
MTISPHIYLWGGRIILWIWVVGMIHWVDLVVIARSLTAGRATRQSNYHQGDAPSITQEMSKIRTVGLPRSTLFRSQ